MVAIYKISCPIAGDIKYIGQTKTPNKRLCYHKSAKSSSVGKWISGLCKDGMMPVFSIIENVDDADALKRERYWIQKVSKNGKCLLNIFGNSYIEKQKSINRKILARKNRKHTNAILRLIKKYKLSKKIFCQIHNELHPEMAIRYTTFMYRLDNFMISDEEFAVFDATIKHTDKHLTI